MRWITPTAPVQRSYTGRTGGSKDGNPMKVSASGSFGEPLKALREAARFTREVATILVRLSRMLPEYSGRPSSLHARKARDPQELRARDRRHHHPHKGRPVTLISVAPHRISIRASQARTAEYS